MNHFLFVQTANHSFLLLLLLLNPKQTEYVLEDRHQNVLVCCDSLKAVVHHICGKLSGGSRSIKSKVISEAIHKAKLGRKAFEMNGTLYHIRRALKDSDRFGLSDLGRRVLEFDANGERIDISSDEDSYHDQMGIVSQEPTLFSGTIAKNISYGAPNASRGDIEAACC